MGATLNFAWTLPTNGADSGTWGTELNATISAIDAQMFLAAPLASPSFTGTPGGVSYTVNGAAATVRFLNFQTAALNRWQVNATATAEAGSNAGTDFTIARYGDTGTLIDTPLTITRSTGLMTLSGGLTVTGTITGALTGNVTGNVTGNASGSSGSCTGNAATATLATNSTNATTATNVSGGTVSCTTLAASGAATFSASAATAPVAVTFGATSMTVNCALSNVFTTTYTANSTSGLTFTNPADGQTINWFITQDGTGSRTASWPSAFKWAGGTAGVLSTAAGSVDLLVATYRASTGFWYVSLSKGFA